MLQEMLKSLIVNLTFLKILDPKRVKINKKSL